VTVNLINEAYEDQLVEFEKRGIPIKKDPKCSDCSLDIDLKKLEKYFMIKVVHENKENGKIKHRFFDLKKCT
jgi:hypothetical protein